MLSYLIATNKSFDILQPTLESIQRLPEHAHEIVVCAPEHLIPPLHIPNVKFIVDDRNDGSTYAFNLGASHCAGDWIVVGTDEHTVRFDVLQFLNVIESPEMEKQDFQVINLGSPWTDTVIKQILSFPPIDSTDIPAHIQSHGYPVITFPAVSRKTINTQFNGMLFNPNLLHHFVDHWIGCYVSAKQPNGNFHPMGGVNAWGPFRSTMPNPKWDNHDANVFCHLASKLLKGEPCRYIDNI
jgi:hypothetical protein